ncbi:unnamed protein product [Amoebophrya sp. A25]|nr:unnamed protein product [Amoebophrya sp. A25]|eukprot:GSA25T00015504001.1
MSSLGGQPVPALPFTIYKGLTDNEFKFTDSERRLIWRKLNAPKQQLTTVAAIRRGLDQVYGRSATPSSASTSTEKWTNVDAELGNDTVNSTSTVEVLFEDDDAFVESGTNPECVQFSWLLREMLARKQMADDQKEKSTMLTSPYAIRFVDLERPNEKGGFGPREIALSRDCAVSLAEILETKRFKRLVALPRKIPEIVFHENDTPGVFVDTDAVLGEKSWHRATSEIVAQFRRECGFPSRFMPTLVGVNSASLASPRCSGDEMMSPVNSPSHSSSGGGHNMTSRQVYKCEDLISGKPISAANPSLVSGLVHFRELWILYTLSHPAAAALIADIVLANMRKMTTPTAERNRRMLNVPMLPRSLESKHIARRLALEHDKGVLVLLHNANVFYVDHDRANKLPSLSPLLGPAGKSGTGVAVPSNPLMSSHSEKPIHDHQEFEKDGTHYMSDYLHKEKRFFLFADGETITHTADRTITAQARGGAEIDITVEHDVSVDVLPDGERITKDHVKARMHREMLVKSENGFMLYTETDTESHDEIRDELPLVRIQFSDRTLLRIANYNDWHRGHPPKNMLRRSLDLERYARDGGKRFLKEYFGAEKLLSHQALPISPEMSAHKMQVYSPTTKDGKKAGGANQIHAAENSKYYRAYECLATYTVPEPAAGDVPHRGFHVAQKFVLLDNPWKFAVALGHVDLLRRLVAQFPDYSPEACLDGSRVYDLLFSEQASRFGFHAVHTSRKVKGQMLEILLAHPLANPHWLLHMLLVCFHEQAGSWAAMRELPTDYVNVLLNCALTSARQRGVKSELFLTYIRQELSCVQKMAEVMRRLEQEKYGFFGSTSSKNNNVLFTQEQGKNSSSKITVTAPPASPNSKKLDLSIVSPEVQALEERQSYLVHLQDHLQWGLHRLLDYKDYQGHKFNVNGAVALPDANLREISLLSVCAVQHLDPVREQMTTIKARYGPNTMRVPRIWPTGAKGALGNENDTRTLDHRIFWKPLFMLMNRDDIDVNAYSANGKTALHLAIELGNVEGVELLLQHPGVNIGLKIQAPETILASEQGKKNKKGSASSSSSGVASIGAGKPALQLALDQAERKGLTPHEKQRRELIVDILLLDSRFSASNVSSKTVLARMSRARADQKEALKAAAAAMKVNAAANGAGGHQASYGANKNNLNLNFNLNNKRSSNSPRTLQKETYAGRQNANMNSSLVVGSSMGAFGITNISYDVNQSKSFIMSGAGKNKKPIMEYAIADSDDYEEDAFNSNSYYYGSGRGYGYGGSTRAKRLPDEALEKGRLPDEALEKGLLPDAALEDFYGKGYGGSSMKKMRMSSSSSAMKAAPPMKIPMKMASMKMASSMKKATPAPQKVSMKKAAAPVVKKPARVKKPAAMKKSVMKAAPKPMKSAMKIESMKKAVMKAAPKPMKSAMKMAMKMAVAPKPMNASMKKMLVKPAPPAMKSMKKAASAPMKKSSMKKPVKKAASAPMKKSMKKPVKKVAAPMKKSMKKALPPDYLKRLFDKADRDHDGHVDLKEFLAVAQGGSEKRLLTAHTSKVKSPAKMGKK